MWAWRCHFVYPEDNTLLILPPSIRDTWRPWPQSRRRAKLGVPDAGWSVRARRVMHVKHAALFLATASRLQCLDSTPQSGRESQSGETAIRAIIMRSGHAQARRGAWPWWLAREASGHKQAGENWNGAFSPMLTFVFACN